MKITLALLLGALSLSASAVASADPTKKDDAYGYVFQDELLTANNNQAAESQIRILKTGRRDRLLKPRVQFVTEMLKSVENM